MVEFSSRPRELLTRAHQEHGEAFTLDLLVAKINVFSGREAHKQFFEATDEVLNFHKAIAAVAQAVLGKDVFLDPEWERKSPYFVGQGFSRPEKLNAYGPILRDEATKHINKWLQADKVNLYEALSHLVTCVHIRIILGDAAYDKHAEEIARTYFQLESNAVNTFAMMFPNFPSPSKLRNDRARQRLVEIIDGILQASIRADAEKKKKKKDGKEGDEEEEEDDGNNEIGYVGMVYKQDRAKHPVMVYVVHGLALMFGAHTNTAGTLFWVAAELARSRALRDKARAEQEAVLEELDPKKNEVVEDVVVSTKYLAKLDYLDACMKESVRKYSTLLLVRLAMRDTDFVGSDGQRYHIRAGNTVAYSPYMSHYDETIYPNPSQFDPERYTDRDRRQALMNDRHFIQFGAGVHRCPGEKFANLVIKGTLSLVLRSCEFEVVGDFQEPDYHKQAGTPNPVAPIWVKFRPRASSKSQQS